MSGGKESSHALVERFQELPPMPDAASRVLSLLDAPECTAEDLRRVIETDPGLTAAVLRLVNSALFHLPQQVSTVSHAIMILGFLRLRSLTLASVVAGLRGLVPPSAAQARDLLWEHAVQTALAARILSEKAGLAWTEEAFVAGLLHDCGRMVMLAGDADQYVALLELEGSALPSLPSERDVFGTDHQEVGARLLESWNLAPQLIEAVASHHGDVDYDSENAALTALVVLADRMMADAAVNEPVDVPAEFLGFDAASLADLQKEVGAAVNEARSELISL